MAIKLKVLFAPIITMSLAFVLSTFVLVSNASASESTWSATYYPRVDFKGTAVKTTASQLNYNWGTNSPSTKIPKDNFSAVYTKKISLSKAAKYRISGKADDGIQIYVNGVKQVDFWKDGSHYFNKELTLKSGTNNIQVKYYERGSSAYIQVNIQAIEDLRIDKWTAYFYPKVNFTGTPAKQYYTDLKSAWSGSPAAGIPADNFSATFERKLVIPQTAKYKFSGKVDDGIRLYVDGVKYIDYWKDGVHSFNKDISLTAGTHTVKVAYYERGSKASIDLNVQQLQPTIPSDKWLAAYYPKSNLTGIAYYQIVNAINFAWGSGSPAAYIPKDNFSAVYQKNVKITKTGKYKLSGTSDDGIRVYVDGVRQVDLWKKSTNNAFNKEISLSAGTHLVKVEYCEFYYGSKIKVDLEPLPVNPAPPVSFDHWNAAYYPSSDFTGTPVYTELKELDLNLGSNSPISGIHKDNFTAIYEKKVNISEAGKYKLSGTSDDGIRIYVDGVKQVDLWKKSTDNAFDKDLSLSAGAHTIKVEYSENYYSSKIKVDLKPAAVTPPPEVTFDHWTAAYYPSTDFTGTPIYTETKNLDLNWGSNSPITGIPKDNFTAVYEKKVNVSEAGKYKLSGTSDDGIRIYVDGVRQVDLWKKSTDNAFNQEISLAAGTHLIRVEYSEIYYGSKIKVDLQRAAAPEPPPVTEGSWTAAYYPTKDLSGTPLYKTENQLNFSWGTGSPDPTISADYFSAVYEKKVNIAKSGNYRLVGNVDDGMRVYIDGVKVYDLWKVGIQTFDQNIYLAAGTHDLKIEYFENAKTAGIKFDIIEDYWTALYYPLQSFGGSPVELSHEELNFDWAAGSPAPGIPDNNFSVKYSKKVFIPSSGKYRFSGRSDDGIRIKVDGTTQLEDWTPGLHTINKDVTLTPGIHSIDIEYYEADAEAVLDLSFEQVIIKQVTQYTNYSYTLQSAVDKQVASANPQTDKKYDAYVSAGAFSSITGTTTRVGTVSGTWNVRGGIGTSYWAMGEIKQGQKITILSEKLKASDGSYWYKITYPQTWKTANASDVKYYMDVKNFGTSTSGYYQFLKLTGTAGTNAYEVNDKILTASAGVLKGKAQVFKQASQAYNINEVYLISHSLLETGNGTSPLATGAKVRQKRDANGQVILGSDGKPQTIVVTSADADQSYDAIVYNLYGIGANDSCALDCGAKRAFIEGWTSIDKAIIGGAKFVSENYVQQGQDTLYKMRWNPAAPATHQYATDIGWAYKQTTRFYQLYSTLESYTAVYDIPQYSL
ncbi:PA14 domain-containing protein [Peribacillus deserti]|uniref:PA14 domain-containing protein n=1 Tax=Peribacillus deserti TaxID=673318 RepID=UPI0015E06ED9|nr:PA14 domain-containing protein [Peribacillus deserti]